MSLYILEEFAFPNQLVQNLCETSRVFCMCVCENLHLDLPKKTISISQSNITSCFNQVTNVTSDITTTGDEENHEVSLLLT